MSRPQPPSNSQAHQAHQVVYAGDRDAQLRAEWEAARASNPGMFGAITTLAEYVKYKSQAAQYVQDQNRELRQQVETYRPPMNSACSYYMGYSHPQLKAMVNDNMDPGTANQQGAAYNRIGNILANLQADLQKATKAAGDSWEGKAAAKAQGYFTNVAVWSGNAAQAAQLTGNQFAQQEHAASLAKNSMTEPVKYDTRDALKELFTSNPFKVADTIDRIQEKFEEKQKAHEEAARVMSTMSSSFQQSSATMPAFAPPPTLADSGGGDQPTPPPPPVRPPGVNQPYTPPGTSTPPVGNTRPAGLGNSATNPAWVAPGGPNDLNLPGGPGNPGGPGGLNNPGLPGIPPAGFPPGGGGRPGVPGRLTGPGGRPGAGNPGGGAGGRGGGGAGGGPGAGRPGGLGGLGGAAAAAKGFGPGGAAGVMGNQQGGFGPQGSGGAGVSGAAGRGGAAGAGGMGAGAGKGQGDEDKEHKSADYLVSEDNTNDIVGDMPMVAPPVIGG